MQCPVCLECTVDRTVPCAHALCDACAEAWMRRGHHTCPTCRTPIVNMTSRPVEDVGGGVRILFDATGGAQEHLGITLTASSMCAGVRITRLDRRDLAHRAGLRIGEVITHINSRPMTDHKVAIDVMETARVARVSLCLRVRRWRMGF